MTPTAKKECKLVAAGVVLDKESRVLIVQRTPDRDFPLAWEIPGGKVEAGESPQQALVRELNEELGIETTVYRIWDVVHFSYPAYDVCMLVYPCTIAAGQIRTLEVEDYEWSRPEDIQLDLLLPADRPLITRLRKEGITSVYWESAFSASK